MQLGVLDEGDGLFGFRELAAARQVARLLGDNVPLSAIIRSLHQIRQWLPDGGLANLRLSADGDALFVDQAQGRTDANGQFVLPVRRPDSDPDTLFQRAQDAEEAGLLDEAEGHYQRLMKVDPNDPAPAFNLGNLLRSSGRKVEAEAAFRKAVSVDARFAEAWYNLSDLLDEQGRSSDAISCLERALKAEPSYTDAIFNLALLLQRANRHSEAAQYWREYLSKDALSDWASRARGSLKFCEMQSIELKKARTSS